MLNNFKEMTIYQIYPRSFQDTNGDGFGDIKGVIKRLPYLHKLGIDMIWLSPIYKSHQYDNGYDVDDYCSIDPKFGTFEDFDELVKKAKEYNISIMLDMVFNHTSTYHEWFQKALAGDQKYMDYYIFQENKGRTPSNWESKFGGNAWKYVESLDKYYLHLYHEKQADLNWHNPQVREELVKVLKFWKDRGVGGFRFDVINVINKPQIIEDDNQGDGRSFYTDGPLVMTWLQELFAKACIEECVTVGELSSTSIENSVKYTDPNNGGLSMAFNFHHMKVDYVDGDKWTLGQMDWLKFFQLLDKWQNEVQIGGGWSAWFMNNHDQPRALTRFAKSDKYHYELATALAALTHTMRGTPYVYQGEEIGMTNPKFDSIDQYKDYESTNYFSILRQKGISEKEALSILAQKSRDNARIPVRWDDSELGGFTEGKPWIDVHPDKAINYEEAIKNEDSIFYFYQKLIKLRKDHQALAYGDYKKVFFDQNLYVFDRISENENIRVILNFSEEEVSIDQELLKSKDILINNYHNLMENGLNPYQALVVKY